MNATFSHRKQASSPWRIRWPVLRRRAEASNALVRMGAVVGLLLTTGCASIERALQPEAAPQAAPPATIVALEPKAAAPVPPPQAKAAERASAADRVKQPSVATSASPAQGAAQAAAAPPKAPTKPPATPSAAAPPAKSETPAAAPAKAQAAAPLDLKSLESRLKETQAIGVFTKLTLKNQIDELLDRFRAFHQGKVKTSMAELRRSYDMLVLKVLALLQDSDAPLASAIIGSREAIWGILSNPAKFAAV